ncbi:MAG: ferritin-like domain-containing protein [Hymenobacteraceae bacterium]|mgnify:CR=1 FL=1|nr:ferritin-like domain-containing protein [Hymenobacteraceae bacterium]MDX5483174.1 ferritin-like domain-containing protein [Hymenobacteraceae bacterium]
MKLNNLKDLFIHELKDLYNAEQQITKALPKMADKCNSDEVRNAFQKHLRETETQIDRLEQVFKMLNEKPSGEKCEAMEGIIAESKEIMQQKVEPHVMDAALIALAQRVEHYEIAGYGTVCAYAKQLGMREAADILNQTLMEEKKTDQLLTDIAESTINIEAQQQNNRR